MTALIVQVLMSLVAINVARKSRNQTTWTLTQLHWRMLLSIVGAVIGLLLPISSRLNHVANDDEECSRPVELAQIQR